MNDFDKRFKERREKFDKNFERSENLFWVTFFIVLIIGVCSLLFSMWVIIALLQYFGVV